MCVGGIEAMCYCKYGIRILLFKVKVTWEKWRHVIGAGFEMGGIRSTFTCDGGLLYTTCAGGYYV